VGAGSKPVQFAEGAVWAKAGEAANTIAAAAAPIKTFMMFFLLFQVASS
jgi:hypothetical protein